MQPATANPTTWILRLRSITERIDPGTLFSDRHPLEVELGSGDGTFLIDLAKLKPAHNFIGIERLLGRIRKLDRKAHRAGLTNVRGIRIESSYFLEYLLPLHSALAIHVYFPDPWPKRKHHRHRLINERFPAVAHQSLAPGGKIYLRTDHSEYFQQITTVFASSPLFHPIGTPPDLSCVLTDFEKEFLVRGVTTLRAAYQASC